MNRRQQKQQQFTNAIRAGLSNNDPYQLAKVFRLDTESYTAASTGSTIKSQPASFVDDTGTDWSNILTLLLDANDSLHAGNAIKCYEYQALLHGQFNQLFASSTGNWLVPALHAICKTTHKVAMLADTTKGGSNQNIQVQQQDNIKLQNAVTLLQESFSRTYNDRKELQSINNFPITSPQYNTNETFSKKVGVIGIVNELFIIYFYLNTLRLCKNLIKPVEAKKLHIPNTGGVTTGQYVTYLYYTGRLYLFEDQYTDAETNLQLSYTITNTIIPESENNNSTTTSAAFRNQRRILRYLIPVKLYRGRLPSIELLQKYKLNEFILLVNSFKKGDLRTFNNALIDYQHRFIRQGTYLLLEKCKTVCYRNLFKRIHYAITTTPSASSTTTDNEQGQQLAQTQTQTQVNQISLSQIQTIFHWLHMIIDLDEIECILANLIYRGYVRGYIAHTKRILVLSKRDPFPLSSILGK